MKTCKHCKKQVGDSRCCQVQKRTITKDDSSDFLTSAAIGYATNNGVLGGIIGGDLVGGMIGDMFNND